MTEASGVYIEVNEHWQGVFTEVSGFEGWFEETF
jgi:hypothetical protein